MSKIKFKTLVDYNQYSMLSSIVQEQISNFIDNWKDSLNDDDWIKLSDALELEVETDESIYYTEKKRIRNLEEITKLEEILNNLRKEVT